MIKKVSKYSVLCNIKYFAIKTTIVTNNIWNKTQEANLIRTMKA